MNIKCVLCDIVEHIDGDSQQANQLSYSHLKLFLCNECEQRITHKTNLRHQTGKFRLYKKETKEKYI